MLSILNVVAPVFALVAVGFLAVRFRLYPATGVRGLLTFVNNFATPCLLFRAALSVDFQSVFNPYIIIGFYTGAIIAFTLGIILSRTFFGDTPGEAAASGFGGMFSNCVLLGIPIIQRAFGDAALPTIYSILSLHAAILMTLAILVIELSRRDGTSLGKAVTIAGRRIATNPLLIGLGLGLIGNVAGLQLIEAADAFTLMMAMAVVPVALFGLGGALNEYQLRENWTQALAMSGLKLLVQPAIAWVLLVPVFNVEHEIARYAVVLAAMPTGINAYIFATIYNRSVDVAANTVLISTALSVLSISMWLYIMSF